MEINPILLTDSYKVTHWPQYPPGTFNVYSYFESRGGQFKDTVFFGLQSQLIEYLSKRITLEHVREAEHLFKAHFGTGSLFNREGWIHVIDAHGGKLPLSIMAVAEGTVVPVSNVLMTVENTCPKCYWLTNYVETLLVQCWYPTTVATLSREAKKIILRYLERTGDPAGVDFKLHDFGFRGVSSPESAGIGGLAHLVNFKGTDTLAALIAGARYYDEPCAGHSLPASEHSTITSWGPARELDAFRNMLDKYPTGLVACVSDSFDITQACAQYWSRDLRERVLSRDGCLVVRPDSGYPPHITREVVTILAEAFGTTINAKGYKVLNPHVRVIQGDGVNLDTIEACLHELQINGYSADNLAFGMGGALLQSVNRDTQKFAFKCSAIADKDGERAVWKDPVTDKGKRSKRGRLELIQTETGEYQTLSRQGRSFDNLLREVYRDGEILIRHSFVEVRDRAKLV